jgi:hypothetical protein
MQKIARKYAFVKYVLLATEKFETIEILKQLWELKKGLAKEK